MERLPDISEIKAHIRRFAHQPGWSKSRLAIESGLHANALRSLDDPDWSPRLDTLEKVADTVRRLEAPTTPEAA